MEKKSTKRSRGKRKPTPSESALAIVRSRGHRSLSAAARAADIDWSTFLRAIKRGVRPDGPKGTQDKLAKVGLLEFCHGRHASAG